MGDGAADGTGKGETRVQSKALELLRLIGLDGLDDAVELLGTGGSHLGQVVMSSLLGKKDRTEWRGLGKESARREKS